MGYTNSEQIKIEKQQLVLDKIKANPNKHKYVSGSYETKDSVLVVFCESHHNYVTTTFTNYKRCKTGLACCGKKQVSDTLLNRQYSPETIEKMSIGALNRPARNPGTGQDWRRAKSSVIWSKKVKEQ